MLRTDSKPRLVFLVKAETDEGSHGMPAYFHLRAELLALEEVDGELRVRGLIDHPQFDGLEVSCQATRGDDTASGRTYGWSVDFRRASYVDLARAQAMVKTLGKVERAIARIPYEQYPPDWAAYLLEVAKVLGVRDFRYWVRRPRQFLDTGELGELGRADLADWCANRTAEFHDGNRKEGAA